MSGESLGINGSVVPGTSSWQHSQKPRHHADAGAGHAHAIHGSCDSTERSDHLEALSGTVRFFV
jgi:hypothetical protein